MGDLKGTIFAAVDEELAHIEKALANNLKPNFNLVSKVSGHILFSGGKRLRPLLMVMSAELCNYDGYDRFKYSTMFEYLHAATLLHDDVVDGADVRRGRTVANYLWDCPIVLLTGDFLLARSIAIAASTGMCSIVEVIAEVAEKMSQGELCQLERKKDFLLAEDEYLKIISCKTAIVFSGACRSGALLACADSSRVDALANYGYNLGMAFQMTDDLLDFSQDLLNTGKKMGADLREGKLTMPVIFSISRASRINKEKMCSIASAGKFSESEFSWFVSALEKYGGIEYTRQRVLEYVNRAKKALGVFGDSDIARILSDIVDYVLVRKV